MISLPLTDPQIKVEPQVKIESENHVDFLITKSKELIIYQIPSIFPSLSLLGLDKYARPDFPLWQSILNFVKFVNETRHIQVTQDVIKENTCLKSSGTESPNILDLFGFVLFKYCFKSSTIFSTGCDSHLLAHVVLRYAIYQKQISKITQHITDNLPQGLKVRVPSDNQFWTMIQKYFLFVEPNILKSQWEKLKRRQPIKRSWCKEEINMLREIVKKTSGKKLWSVVAKNLSQTSGGKFRRNGKQCSEKWKSILLENGNKKVWSRKEDVLLLKCVLEFGFDWRQISEKMKFKSKYIIKRRFHKILRKYKFKLENGDLLSHKDKENLQGVVYNLENSDKYFCPLFYSQNKGIRLEREVKPGFPDHKKEEPPGIVTPCMMFAQQQQKKEEPSGIITPCMMLAQQHHNEHFPLPINNPHLHSSSPFSNNTPSPVHPQLMAQHIHQQQLNQQLQQHQSVQQLPHQSTPHLQHQSVPHMHQHQHQYQHTVQLQPQAAPHSHNHSVLHHNQSLLSRNQSPQQQVTVLPGLKPPAVGNNQQIPQIVSPSLGFKRFYNQQINDYNFSHIPFSVPKILTCQNFANLDLNKSIQIASMINPQLNTMPNLRLCQKITTAPSTCLMDYFMNNHTKK